MNESPAKKRRGQRLRSKPREEQAESAKEQWVARKEARKRELCALYGRHVKDFDAYDFDTYGKLLAKGDVKEHDVRGEDVATGLDRAYAATGDPLFADALAALRAYGLAGGKPRTSHNAAENEAWGDQWLGYLQQMRWFVENKSPSVRAAADDVAAKFFVDGKSFDAVTKDLRDNYSLWAKAGFPEQPSADRGDVGYHVLARPCAGKRVTHPCKGRPLAPDGEVVAWTAYWRRRFADGAIEISRVKLDENYP